MSASVHAGIHTPGQTPPRQTHPPSRRLLKRTVCILLECILVLQNFCRSLRPIPLNPPLFSYVSLTCQQSQLCVITKKLECTWITLQKMCSLILNIFNLTTTTLLHATLISRCLKKFLIAFFFLRVSFVTRFKIL